LTHTTISEGQRALACASVENSFAPTGFGGVVGAGPAAEVGGGPVPAGAAVGAGAGAAGAAVGAGAGGVAGAAVG
jgi:hypothetical protein